MLRRLGYVAISLSLGGIGNRTCRLANATPVRLRELITLNLDALESILLFNAEHDIKLYRISSKIILFASHPVNELEWWNEFGDRLRTIGDIIKRHDIRVSMHPGQYTVLNSPRPDVVTNAIADLRWHTHFLDALGVDDSCKVNIHVGGIYGDKTAAMDRFVAVADNLPRPILRRLTIENDDRTYTANDLIEVASRAGLPFVFDWLHHHANPNSTGDVTEIMRRCFESWKPEDGIPKTHYSTQSADLRPGAHSQFIDPDDFLLFLDAAPDQPFDCMLECKSKDLALLRLREDLQARGIEQVTMNPIHANIATLCGECRRP
ncbi:UV DNA damage repair endonuclease UvsE [soil metagenome]